MDFENTQYDYDYIVIGSGFGGSVSACRLTEKGYSVAVLEMGKRYRAEDFPKSNWNLRKYFWLPAAKLHGFFRMTLFRHVFVLSGVGVGGGSLTYANTLLVPPDRVWDDPRWKDLNNWKDVMPQFYGLAEKNLGVTENRYFGKADKMLREAASEQGYGETFYPTRVGVYFGKPGEKHADPYFDGEGPERTACNYCGSCMTGCHYGSKNTLDKNYLYFAEKRGAKVFAERKVVDVIPLGDADGVQDGSAGYEIHTERSTAWFNKDRKVFRARAVVFSAGVLGTVGLLSKLKKTSLPNLSDRLGDYVRTNSESILGVRVPESEAADVTDGVAIGSGIYIDEHTHVEAVRYGRGNDAIGPLTTIMTHGKAGPTRILTWLATIVRRPLAFLRVANPIGLAKSTVILLVMQTLDGHLQMRRRTSRWPSWVPFVGNGQLVTEGPRPAAFIPQANDFTEKMAEKFNGVAITSITEIALNVPTTAHILGGASMGADASEGVIDARNHVFGYKNMLVCDGSMIGANLGVNPSLTITALSEHAMSHIPAKSQSELRRNDKVALDADGG